MYAASDTAASTAGYATSTVATAGSSPYNSDAATAPPRSNPKFPTYNSSDFSAAPSYGMDVAGTGTEKAWVEQNSKPPLGWETWLSLAFTLVVIAMWVVAIFVSFRRNRGFRAPHFFSAFFCCPFYLIYAAAVKPSKK